MVNLLPAEMETLSLETCSVDLHLAFLRAIHARGGVQGVELALAVARYEDEWLPRLAAGGCVELPTLAVTWVWHLHRLAPLRYASYCVARFGRVLDPGALAFGVGDDERLVASTVGTEHAGVDVSPFHDVERLGGYAVAACSERQKNFLWQCTGASYEDCAFLAAAVERYDRFLRLMGEHRSKFFVPSYDIDLAWHTHMLADTSRYLSETAARAGHPVDHDDSVNDRSEGSQLNVSWAETKSLWTEAYGETDRIDKQGATFRSSVQRRSTIPLNFESG